MSIMHLVHFHKLSLTKHILNFSGDKKDFKDKFGDLFNKDDKKGGEGGGDLGGLGVLGIGK